MDHILVNAKSRITAYKEVAGWWEELSPEGQAEYLKEHPDSKKSQEIRQKMEKNRDDRPSSQALKNNDEKKEHPDMVKHQPDHPKNVEHLHPDAQQFFKDGHDKKGSPERKKAASFIKKKSKQIIKSVTKSMKHQVSEWKHGTKGIGKLMNCPISKLNETYGKLNDHEKEGMKSMILDVAATVGLIAVSGGLAHGVWGALHHVGKDVLIENFFKSMAKGVIEHGKELAGAGGLVLAKGDKSPEEVIQYIINFLADYAENGDIPKDAWLKAANEEPNEDGEKFQDKISKKSKSYKPEKDDGSDDSDDDKE